MISPRRLATTPIRLVTAPFRALTRAAQRNARTIFGMIGSILGPHYTAASARSFWLAYSRNELVYAAIGETIRSLTPVPLIADRWSPKARRWVMQSPSDPLQRLLDRPNPIYDRASFWNRFWTDVAVLGNGLLWVQRNGRGQATALWPIAATNAVLRLAADGVTPEGYYAFTDGSVFGTGLSMRDFRIPAQGPYIRFDPRDVMHLALSPDPNFPAWGLSPIAPALVNIDAYEAIMAFMIAFFQQGAVVTHAYTSEAALDEDEIKRIKARWAASQEGVDKAWSLAVIDGTRGQLQRIGLATGAREIGLHELAMDVEARILAPLNVPPVVVGSVVGLTNATYSNMEQARQAMYEENTNPNLVRLGSLLTHGLASEFGGQQTPYRVRADTSGIWALESLRSAHSERITREVQAWLRMQNEGRAALDLPPTPDGDRFLRPLAWEPTTAEPFEEGLDNGNREA